MHRCLSSNLQAFAMMMDSVLPTAIAPFFLGGIVHSGFFARGEWHIQAPHIFLVHFVVWILLFTRQLLSVRSSWYDIAISSFLYLCGLSVSIAVYRLFFHRLRSFPGPRFAALSKLWHVWLCRDSRNHLVLESWHQKYGPFVRTGPSEVTIFHPAGLEWLDGPQSHNARSDWYDLLHPSIQVFSRDAAIQASRRKVWDKAMSMSAVKQYYPRIASHVHQLVNKISTQKATPVVMNDLLYEMTYDVLKDIGFGQAHEEVKDGASILGGSLTILGPTTPAPWILRLAFAVFPWAWNIPRWFKFLEMLQGMVVKRVTTSPESLDIASFFIDDAQRKEADMISREAVGGDCGVILLAGSTSGPSLILLLYCLARWPEQADKIRQELQNVDYNDMMALSALPHLTAAINESLRLYPAGPTFGSRITPPEGLNCDGVFIPGGTKVVAPRWSTARLEEAYAFPHEFIPERWYSKPELVKDKRAFAPFSMGHNSCAGKKVALAQLRLTVAILFSKYSIRLAPGTEMRVEDDMRDQLTPLPGDLELIFEALE